MTLKEVSELIGKSEGTISKNFKRTKETLAKKGIILEKIGKGPSAEYNVSYIEIMEDKKNNAE